jgi:hypothetical protein
MSKLVWKDGDDFEWTRIRIETHVYCLHVFQVKTAGKLPPLINIYQVWVGSSLDESF